MIRAGKLFDQVRDRMYFVDMAETVETKSRANRWLGKAGFWMMPVCWPFVGTAMIFTGIAALSLENWIPDIFTNFYAQYFILELAFCLALTLAGRRWQALSVAPFLAICLAKIVFLYIPEASRASASSKFATESRLGILQINLNSKNRSYDLVKKCIGRYSPDIILLEEVDKGWAEQSRYWLERGYKIAGESVREDNFGIIVMSRLPVLESRMVTIGYMRLPAVTATLEKGGKKFSFIGAHVFPPISEHYFRERNLQYNEIALHKRNLSKSLIIAGDMNTSAWSPYFSELLRNSGLKDSARGFGLQATWPQFLGPFGIGIDHCLVSDDFKVLRRETGPNVGSDHLPLFVELGIEK